MNDTPLAEKLERVVRLVAAAIAALFGLVLDVLAAILSIFVASLTILAALAPALARLLIAFTAVSSSVWCAARLLDILGGDVFAILPALALTLSPFAFGFTQRRTWDALLLGAVAAFAMGALFPTLHPVVRGIAISGVIAATLTHSLIQDSGGQHAKNKS